MILLAATAISLTLGYNSPFVSPWMTDRNFNEPDQFHEALISVTAKQEFTFIKAVAIVGNDSHNGKYAGNGEWILDTSGDLPDKHLLIAGARYEWDRLSGFIGAGYLDQPDNVRLSGHFQMNLGINYTFENLEIGIEHFSNGAGIWGGDLPNEGIDFFTIGWKL